MMNKKIYVFDLDNTLCKTNGSIYLEAEPIRERIEKVNSLYDSGNIIIIETARGCISGKNWFYDTVEQLSNWGLKFHTLRTNTKFMADYYIDDKGINSEVFFENSENDASLNKESGSGVQTNVLIVNRVLKEATDERVDKLIDEINFIETMPEEFKKKFPEIMFSRIENNKAFYEMKHHNLPTIRRLILSGDMESEEILKWSDKITEFSMKMYNHEKLDIKPQEAMTKLHWDRFDNRMLELKKKSPWFKDHLKEDKIVVNDQEYYNILFLHEKIKQKESWFLPEFVGRWSHSDLHFSNILIDRKNNDFVLIDPRGYDFCDYYYDYGKLWHSVNGKYELIASRMYDVSDHNSKHRFQIHQNKAYHSLEDSKEGVLEIFFKNSKQDNDTVVLKTEFNDVMHFATLVPFLLEFDTKEERARVAYYQSIVLMNKFCKKHGII